jgi:hypothetical protein
VTAPVEATWRLSGLDPRYLVRPALGGWQAQRGDDDSVVGWGFTSEEALRRLRDLLSRPPDSVSRA